MNLPVSYFWSKTSAPFYDLRVPENQEYLLETGDLEEKGIRKWAMGTALPVLLGYLLFHTDCGKRVYFMTIKNERVISEETQK